MEDTCIHDGLIEGINIDNSKQLNDHQTLQIKHLLYKHKDIFSQSDTDIGNCNMMKHRKDLIDEPPFKQRHRRIPPMIIDEIRRHLEQQLSAGIKRKSKSHWA
jgi:hypothetical protein